MAVRRSPTQRPITCTDRNEPIATRSGSQPDLRKFIQTEKDMKNTPIRKRKQPEDELYDKFNNLEEKIMMAITKTAQMHTEKLDQISQDVSLITVQLSQIKSITDKLVTEQNVLKKEVEMLKQSKVDLEKKVNNLVNDFGTIKTYPITNTAVTQEKNAISEILDRLKREKNVVVYGIAAKNTKQVNERFEHDKQEVYKIIKLANPDVTEPKKFYRLGRFNSDRPRPIKVCFETADMASSILRNRTKISDQTKNIKCFPDQTPYQTEEKLKLRAELKERTEKGEENLIIKYIKGIPKIVKISLPKNGPKQ